MYYTTPYYWALLGESYLSAEMPLAYSADPADSALFGESNPFAEMQSVYSTTPADWARSEQTDWYMYMNRLR